MSDPDDRTMLLRLATTEDVQVLRSRHDEGVCLDEAEVSPLFFDLGTGVAGDVLQTCTNYRFRLAIVVPDPARHGERFAELAREHRSHALIRFPRTRAHGEAWLNVK